MQMVSVTLSAASSLSPEHTMTSLRYARLTGKVCVGKQESPDTKAVRLGYLHENQKQLRQYLGYTPL